MSDRFDDDRTRWWNDAYRDDDVPWETARPQTEIVARAESGAVDGRVLDVGCGVGTEALALADRGHDVVGVDFAAAAVDRARERAAERDVDGDVRFLVADALALPAADLGTFDTVVDVGLLHTLERGDRPAYAASLASVLETGGRAVLLEFGADAPDDWGPIPLSPPAVERTFDDRWRVETVDSAEFETRQSAVPALSAVVVRTD